MPGIKPFAPAFAEAFLRMALGLQKASKSSLREGIFWRAFFSLPVLVFNATSSVAWAHSSCRRRRCSRIRTRSALIGQPGNQRQDMAGCYLKGYCRHSVLPEKVLPGSEHRWRFPCLEIEGLVPGCSCTFLATRRRASARAETVPLSRPPVTLSCFRGHKVSQAQLYELQNSVNFVKFAEVRAEGECVPVAACHTEPLCRQPPPQWQCCIGRTYRLRVEGSDARDDGQPTKLKRSRAARQQCLQEGKVKSPKHSHGKAILGSKSCLPSE